MKYKKDAVILGLFFSFLVFIEVIIGKTFEVGFFTDFNWLDKQHQTSDFWKSIAIQFVCIILLVLAVASRKD